MLFRVAATKCCFSIAAAAVDTTENGVSYTSYLRIYIPGTIRRYHTKYEVHVRAVYSVVYIYLCECHRQEAVKYAENLSTACVCYPPARGKVAEIDDASSTNECTGEWIYNIICSTESATLRVTAVGCCQITPHPSLIVVWETDSRNRGTSYVCIINCSTFFFTTCCNRL